MKERKKEENWIEMNVLIIDENPFDFVTFEKFFSGWATMIKTKVPSEGITYIEKRYASQSPFDIIFLSMTIPNIDVISILRQVRETENARRVMLSPNFWTQNGLVFMNSPLPI